MTDGRIISDVNSLCGETLDGRSIIFDDDRLCDRTSLLDVRGVLNCITIMVRHLALSPSCDVLANARAEEKKKQKYTWRPSTMVFSADGAGMICERIVKVNDVPRRMKSFLGFYDLSASRRWICLLSWSWYFYGNEESRNTCRMKQCFLSHLIPFAV